VLVIAHLAAVPAPAYFAKPACHLVTPFSLLNFCFTDWAEGDRYFGIKALSKDLKLFLQVLLARSEPAMPLLFATKTYLSLTLRAFNGFDAHGRSLGYSIAIFLGAESDKRVELILFFVHESL